MLAEYCDLAAVGTVADVMPMTGENRTIVRVGLKHLKKTRRRGLYALMVEAGDIQPEQAQAAPAHLWDKGSLRIPGNPRKK